MKASLEWLSTSAAAFRAEEGRVSYAHLKYYTAEFCEWGEGPPLVLIPGLAGGYELLGPLARLLARDFRVITYQLRGEDDCFALRRRFNLKDLVDDLTEFLDWHCLESPIVLGVSFGGVLALELAARLPYRVQSLIVQGAGARFERGLVQQVASMVLGNYPLPADNPFVNQFFNLLFGGRQKPSALVEFVTRQCWQTDQSVMAHRFRLAEKFNLESRLHRLTMPTLVLAGGRDMLASPQSLAALCAGVPHARHVQLPDCGHLAFVTHPERVAAEVRGFLRIEDRG